MLFSIFLLFSPFCNLNNLILYIKIVQNFNITTLAVTQRELVFLSWNFHLFVMLFIFLTFFTVYKLNISYFIYTNCSTFQKKHIGQYPKAIDIFKFQKCHLFMTHFLFFPLFTIYNLNNSYFIYEICSKFQ